MVSIKPSRLFQIYDDRVNVMKKIKVNILGKQYAISTEEEEDYLAELASTINTQADEILKNVPGISVNDACVLTTLNFLDAQKKSEKSADNMRLQLVEYLDEINRTQTQLANAKRELDRLKREDDILKVAQHQNDLLNNEVSALKAQVGSLEGELTQYRELFDSNQL